MEDSACKWCHYNTASYKNPNEKMQVFCEYENSNVEERERCASQSLIGHIGNSEPQPRTTEQEYKYENASLHTDYVIVIMVVFIYFIGVVTGYLIAR